MFFAIDNNNDVTTHDAQPEAAEGMITFTSQKDLAQATAGWPTSRFVELWNSFAGTPGTFSALKEIKKFTDRKTAVNRIWSVLQALGKDGATAPQTATDAPETATATTDASPAADAPKGKKTAKGAKPAKDAKAAKAAKPAKTAAKTAKTAATPGTVREGSKKAAVIALMSRKQGTTNQEIQAATDWLPHSVRGFISGILGKKMGIAVESFKDDKGARRYRINQ